MVFLLSHSLDGLLVSYVIFWDGYKQPSSLFTCSQFQAYEMIKPTHTLSSFIIHYRSLQRSSVFLPPSTLPSSLKYLPTSYSVKHNKLMQTNSFILQVTASNPPLLHSTLRPKIRFPLESPFLPAISSFRTPEQECGRAVLISLRRLRWGSLLYTCYSFNKSPQNTRVTSCLKLTRFRFLSEARKKS